MMMAWVLTIAILFVLWRLTRKVPTTASDSWSDVCPDCCLCDCAEKGCGYLRHYELTDAGKQIGLQPGEVAAVLTPGESWWECPGCGTWGPTDKPLNHLPGCSVHRS